MGNEAAIAKKEPTSVLALYTAEQVDIIRKHVAGPSFTDNELAYCLSVAQARDLDPLARQIYFTKRKQWVGRGMPGADSDGFSEKIAAEPTIDGFRVMADRTKEMGGYDDPVWCGPDGKWVDVWLNKEPPAAAKVRVYRKGREHSYSAIARFDEYAQRKKDGGLNTMWAKMPANQLAKCAEALALRKAFPEQFGGLYSHEEMGQADNPSKFDALKEAPKPEVVDAPSSNVKRLPPKSEAKKSPAKWTSAQPIPAVIMSALPLPLRELKEIPVDRLAEDDLEMLLEHGKKAYVTWKQMPNVAPKALALLQEIVLTATELLGQRQGEHAPPPDDGAPKDADMQQPPIDYDPTTGEVHQ